jgi:catechol 2,3-dioxygenase-like lactoylglutathione lyase family enzyme
VVDYLLEVIEVPVSDFDRARDFYVGAGFHLDVDLVVGEDFRVVQLTPPGSACSITLKRNDAPGSLQGLYLIVTDAAAAHADLSSRGVPVSEPFHFGPSGQEPGPDPDHGDFETYLSFSDPDGNGWLVQEVPSRA